MSTPKIVRVQISGIPTGLKFTKSCVPTIPGLDPARSCERPNQERYSHRGIDMGARVHTTVSIDFSDPTDKKPVRLQISEIQSANSYTVETQSNPMAWIGCEFEFISGDSLANLRPAIRRLSAAELKWHNDTSAVWILNFE